MDSGQIKYYKSYTPNELKVYEDALAAYEGFLQRDPNDTSSHTLKGNALIALRRYEEALVSFDRAN